MRQKLFIWYALKEQWAKVSALSQGHRGIQTNSYVTFVLSLRFIEQKEPQK